MKKPTQFQFASDIHLNVHLFQNFEQTDELTDDCTVHLEGAEDGASGSIAFQQDGTGRTVDFDVDGYTVVVDGAIPDNDGVTLLVLYRFATVNGVKLAFIHATEYDTP